MIRWLFKILCCWLLFVSLAFSLIAEEKKDIQNTLGISFYGSFLHTEKVPNALFFFSDIENDDSFELRKALRNHEINTLVLSSAGGSVFEGLQMAGIISDKGLTTYVPKEGILGEGNCASACAFMFFGGKTRLSDGKLGVHQFKSGKASEDAKIGDVQELAQFTVSEIIGFLNEFETPPFVYERMFQDEDMYYFKTSELEKIHRFDAQEISKNDKANISNFISDFKIELAKLEEEENQTALSKNPPPKTVPSEKSKPADKIVTQELDLNALQGRWHVDYANSELYETVEGVLKKCSFITSTLSLSKSRLDDGSYVLVWGNGIENINLSPNYISWVSLSCHEGDNFFSGGYFSSANVIKSNSKTFIEFKGRPTDIGDSIWKLRLSREKSPYPNWYEPKNAQTTYKNAVGKWYVKKPIEISSPSNCTPLRDEFELRTIGRSITTTHTNNPNGNLSFSDNGVTSSLYLKCREGGRINTPTKRKIRVRSDRIDISGVYSPETDLNKTKMVNVVFLRRKELANAKERTSNNPSFQTPKAGNWYINSTGKCGIQQRIHLYAKYNGLSSAGSVGAIEIGLDGSVSGFLNCKSGYFRFFENSSFVDNPTGTTTTFTVSGYYCSTKNSCSYMPSNQEKILFTRFKPKLQVSSKKSLIKEAQLELNRLGCNAGIADGVIGARTRAALARYGKTHNAKYYDTHLYNEVFVANIKRATKKCDVQKLKASLAGMWSLESKSCRGGRLTAAAELKNRRGNTYDFLYRNQYNDYASGTIIESGNQLKIALKWDNGQREKVQLNFFRSQMRANGYWRECYVEVWKTQ